MSGKRIRGACGHEHEYVFNQFAVCTVKGCDGKGGQMCTGCGGTAFSPFSAPLVPPGSVSCDRCGKVRWSWR